MFTLDLLGVAFARLVLIRIEVARVGTPIVRIIFRDAKGFQESFQLQKCLILTTAKDIGQNLTTVVIDGMLKPSLIFLALNKRPHLISFGFGFTSELNHNFYLIRVEQVEYPLIQTTEFRLFF